VPLFSAILGYLVQAFFNISVVSVAYVFWVFLGLLAGDCSTKCARYRSESSSIM